MCGECKKKEEVIKYLREQIQKKDEMLLQWSAKNDYLASCLADAIAEQTRLENLVNYGGVLRS